MSMLKSALTGALTEPVVKQTISMEALDPADGVTRVEQEIEIYGTMRDMSQLEAATSWEIQEQWGLYIPKTAKNGGTGGPRVRMSQPSGGEPVYVLTTKVKGAAGNDECEEPSSLDMFEMFKRLAESGLRKKRYFFPIPNTEMTFEIDVFTGPNGTPLPDVKIDLEIRGTVPEGFDARAVTLPVDLDNVRIIAPGHKSPEDLAYVRELFKQYDLPNPHLGSEQPGTQASMEEFPPPGCTCGKCGWGSTCKGPGTTPESGTFIPKTNGEPISDGDNPVDSNPTGDDLMGENLLNNKDSLMSIMETADGISRNLSFNGPTGEAAVKTALRDVVTTVGKAFYQ